jgi:PIN domain nuclease of toxin-antitoxin system
VILLDTHIVGWLSFEPTKLSRHAKSAIRRAERSGGMAISAITLWELASLISNGRLKLAGTLEAYLDEVSSRFAVRPITTRVAALATQFGVDYSGDPCDRLIGATALLEGIPLVTKDSRIRSSTQLQTIW